MRTLSVVFNYLRMQTKRRPRIVSAVNAEHTRAVTTRCTQWKRMRAPWERHESSGNRQLERRLFWISEKKEEIYV